MATTTMCKLSEPLTEKVLSYLECPRKAPTLRYLNRLIHACIRRVPFESISRIVKRRATPQTKDCPRLPEEFWRDALEGAFGGTCFESSLAFYSLLTSLGYEGYLTVNNMGELRGCHAAITILLGGQKYLVDITIPVHVAVRINPYRMTRRQTPCIDFAIQPVRENVYEVLRSHHPKRTAFTLIDIPIRLSTYRAIVQNDYLETGNFNKSIAVNMVINDRTTRFFSDYQPYRLECFNKHGKRELPLQTETLPRVLAETFHMPEEKIAEALSHVQAVNP
jgi:hypothetical protein